jgi:type IV pilus assembly protein PilQ
MGEMSFKSKGDRLHGVWRLLPGLLALVLFCLPMVLQAADTESPANRMLEISYEKATVHIRTERPVEYRYRIYDAQDPLRVVVDFPGMSLADLQDIDFTADDRILDIRTSLQELPSGSLARVELLLAKLADYDVSPDGRDFQVLFGGNEEAVAAAPAPVTSGPASKVVAVKTESGRVALVTDGTLKKYRYFKLGAPPRLVVDLYDVKPAFAERSFPAGKGFRQIRVGSYADKTRFVFDAEKEYLPEYTVSAGDNGVNVSWDGKAVAKAAPAKATPGAPVTVTAVDFKAEGGRSILTIVLSGPAEIIQPVAAGDVVRFGVKNASISRALRRAVDPSAFPSAIRLITPYTVLAGGAQDVRFAVELKGSVPYALEKEGNSLRFIVKDGPFAEKAPASEETREVPVAPRPSTPSRPAVGGDMGKAGVPAGRQVLSMEMGGLPGADQQYTGQKITLVFDDANIRNILQLIAEVSDLNIIAGDDVKGTITLRLVDVPWDQALDLIMDIKGLGMLREGNVARIMPKEQIRKMREEQFASARALEKLEDMVTEVVTVNYSNVDDVAKRSKEYLTERGKIIEDVRNKNLIVTDIPSVVASIKELVALVDTPERQVLIEARIVEANSNFSRDLGVNWGITYNNDPGGTTENVLGVTGLGGNFALSPSSIALGSAGFASAFRFGNTVLDKVVLDMRLSALESSGQGRIISTPRVTTLNGQEAEIAQGTEIPYTTTSDEGTKTEFKKAELSLKVKPEINPDGSVFLAIEARNDSKGAIVPTVDGYAVAIDTKKAETKVLVQDGETTVIGGIFIEDKSSLDSGVPWLMKIPILGYLFKSRSVNEERRELLIFITPRILE